MHKEMNKIYQVEWLCTAHRNSRDKIAVFLYSSGAHMEFYNCLEYYVTIFIASGLLFICFQIECESNNLTSNIEQTYSESDMNENQVNCRHERKTLDFDEKHARMQFN